MTAPSVDLMNGVRCRRCGDPVFGFVEHPCCVLHDVQPGDVCPACAASRWLNGRWRPQPPSQLEEPDDQSWPVAWWLDGAPQRIAARWPGRGLHLELGVRAFAALTAVDQPATIDTRQVA